MEDRKIVLHIDRNGKDKLINIAQDAIKVFLKNHCPNSQVSPNGEFEIGEIGIVWGIPCRHKENTNNRRKVHDMYRENHRPLLVCERGFLNRDRYFSVGYNSIVGFGYYHNKNMPSDRFDQHKIQPKAYQPDKNKNGGYILICGQVPWDSQLQHLPSYKQWLINLVKQIKQHTNRKIVYRPHPKQKASHPLAVLSIPGAVTSKKPTLEDDFQNSYVVLSYNSNSLVEAMLEGIPFFSFDRGSMVHDIANHDLSQLESPTFPDEQTKMQTLYDIAYSQWNLQEIKDGTFWQHIQQGLTHSMDPEIDSQYHLLKPLFKDFPQ